MTAGEVVATLVAGCLGLILMLAGGFGLDVVAAQMILWSLGSFHVIAGFWQVLWLVVCGETVVSLALLSHRVLGLLG